MADAVVPGNLPPLLQVRGLNVYYGHSHALQGVEFTIHQGALAIVGRNGMGKTTLCKTIMGLVRASSGSIRFGNKDELTRLSPAQIARLGIGYVPEDRRIFTDLTVAENLEVGRQPPRAAAPTWSDEKLFALFPALAMLRDRRGSRMSGGEQQMLCIARTLAGNPTAILLDEPSEGLAPVIVEQVGRAIVELKRAGVAVLLAEQSRHFTARVADRTYLLETGIIRPP